jgi:hypothetical protein
MVQTNFFSGDFTQELLSKSLPYWLHMDEFVKRSWTYNLKFKGSDYTVPLLADTPCVA